MAELLPQGAKEIPQPTGAKRVEPKGFAGHAAEAGAQFIAGLDDVTGLLARPFEAAFGTAVIGPEGVEFLSREETKQLRTEGNIREDKYFGVPGRALEEPTSLVGKGMRVAGQTAALGPIMGRAAGFVSAPTKVATTKAGKVAQFGRKTIAQAGETFARAPVKATTIETGLGFTAGAGGYVAHKVFPDSEAAEFIGEIVGGTAPALMPIRIAVRASGGVRNIIQTARRPFTAIGGRKRAAARAQRAVTPEQRVQALEGLETPTTLDPETGLPVLSPAQRTGEPGLLALERAVVESSEDLSRVGDINIARANEVIQESMQDLGREPVEAAAVVIRDAQDYLSDLLDTRVRIAAQQADERIAELGPKASREQLNRIAREEVDKVLDAARTQEKELYRAIPSSTPVPYSKAKLKYDSLRRSLGTAQQEDIPSVAKRFLSAESKEFYGNVTPSGANQGETTIKELRSLQSKLRQIARNARTGEKKNLNKARISDEIANSIVDDIRNARGDVILTKLTRAADSSADRSEIFDQMVDAPRAERINIANEAIDTPDADILAELIDAPKSKRASMAKDAASAAKKAAARETAVGTADEIQKNISKEIAIAVDFSDKLHDRFDSGTMAKILGRKAAGAPRVPAGLTLEESIGMTGPKAREAMDELIKAFDSPEAPSSVLLVNSAEDYTRSRFLKDAMVSGEVNIRAAERFVRNNAELLNRMPNVKRQIDEVIETGNTMAVSLRQRGRIKLDDPRVSKATMLIDKGPVETFKQISKMKPATAAKEVQKLINRVSKDETGEALSGLKSGFLEFLYSTSREKARDIAGRRFMSGFALRDAIDSPATKEAIKRLFEPDELKRLNIVVDDLIRLEKRRAIKLPPEGVIADKPSKLVETAAGLAGAAYGRSTASRLGMGGTVQIPGIMADRFRGLVAAGVRDPAGRLLRDMIYDESLFKELMQASLEEGGEKLSKPAIRRLNAWTAAVIAEYGGAFDAEEESETVPESIEAPSAL